MKATICSIVGNIWFSFPHHNGCAYRNSTGSNCHGFNISTASYLQTVARDADIILLQETWLCNATSTKLNAALKDFTIYRSSAMENKFASGICNGMPFGCTAVLVHKKLNNQTCRSYQ